MFRRILGWLSHRRLIARMAKQWGPEFATPGFQLTYEEVERQTVKCKVGASDELRELCSYRLRAMGFPTDKAYSLWCKWVDGRIALLGNSFTINNAGYLIVKEEGQDGELVLSFGNMFRGEPIERALTSSDQMIRVLGEVIPFPLEGKGKAGAQLSLRLLTPTGLAFVMHGRGFQPDEEIRALSQSGHEVIQVPLQAGSNGEFVMFWYPGVVGLQGGSAVFTAEAKADTLTLRYEWGTAMERV